MVGIVAVSHSRALAEAAVALATEMVHGERPAIAIAAGLDAETYGTDAMAVREAISSVDSDDGVVVVMDLGSAVLSTDLALDLLEPETAARVEVTAAPFVEGLVAAVVSAAGGGSRSDVAAEAAAGLSGKLAHLGQGSQSDDKVPDAPWEEAALFEVSNPHGLHARPAARLVAEVNRYNARATLTNLSNGVGPVNAASLSRVAALGAVRGHRIEVRAGGPQAAEMVRAVAALAERQFDETKPVESTATDTPATEGAQPSAPGIAIGPKFTLASIPIEIPETTSVEPAAEWRRLREALAAVRTEIARVKLRVSHDVGDDDAAIFDAHLMLLDDRDVLATVRSGIDGGASAAASWKETIDGVEAEWAALDDHYLNARAADVAAIGDQVLRAILGVNVIKDTPEGILVAEDLTPTETAELDPTRVLGVVTAYGSATSHSAILVRSLGIPSVVGTGRWVLDITDGTTMIVDGSEGVVIADPPDDVLARFRGVAAGHDDGRKDGESKAHLPAMTADGLSIDVAANVASAAATRVAVGAGADGVGLLRTELLFLDRKTAPDADEQESVYREIAETLDGRRLVIRTLDVGGDKPLPYAPTPAEANPFLGIRGLRLSLVNRELLDTQLAAIMRVAVDHPVAVMFPMVSTLEEVVLARSAVGKAAADAGVAADDVEIGIMVEVPSAALNASALAPLVDFFSIGTNDLTQYTLAAERGNEAVAGMADPLDPAVLKLIYMVCRAAETTGARVAVCGEAAADVTAVPILTGLGVRELSVSAPAIAGIKEEVRRWRETEMRRLAREALQLAAASDVRVLVEAAATVT